MNKQIKEGLAEGISACLKLCDGDEISKRLAGILFDAMIDVTKNS